MRVLRWTTLGLVGILAAFATTAAGPTEAVAEAAPAVVAIAPTPRVRAVAKNPKATALVYSALARFAANQPADAFDRALADRLGKLPNARATAQRIVAPFAQIPPAERARVLPGGADAMASSKTFDLVQYGFAMSSGALVPQTPATVLAPEPPTPTTYELSYAGLACTTPAAAAGDRVMEYAVLLEQVDTNTVVVTKHSFPTQPLAGMVAGASSPLGNGVAWSNGVFQDFIVVSALLLDEGDLDAKKQEVDLLVTLSESFAVTMSDPDRGKNRKAALDIVLGVLQLSNPDRWSPQAVAAKLVTAADYTTLFTSSPTTTNNIAHKLAFGHDPKGSSYSVFFSTPTAPPNQDVKVTLRRVIALGTEKDNENGLADHSATVMIGRSNGGLSATKALKKDDNDVSPNWTVSRRVGSGSGPVRIEVSLKELDTKIGPIVTCPSPLDQNSHVKCFCIPPPNAPAPEQGIHFVYLGQCPSPQPAVVDVSPGAGTTLTLDYDLATGNITGDAVGKKGQVLSVTGKNSLRKARVDLVID